MLYTPFLCMHCFLDYSNGWLPNIAATVMSDIWSGMGGGGGKMGEPQPKLEAIMNSH